jgi:hypothetical protein
MDVLFVVATIGFFVVGVAYVGAATGSSEVSCNLDYLTVSWSQWTARSPHRCAAEAGEVLT